jgi:hypothetical protein
MSRLSSNLVLASLAFALSACATTMGQSFGEASMFYRDYVGPPEEAGSALVRLSADGVIRITPKSTCADFSKPETGVALFSTFSLKDYRHLHDRKLGMKGDAPPGLVSTEVRLKANEPAVISYTRNWTTRGTVYTCQMHRSFVPQAGAQYQLLAVPVVDEGKCGLVITELAEPPSTIQPTAAKLCGA